MDILSYPEKLGNVDADYLQIQVVEYKPAEFSSDVPLFQLPGADDRINAIVNSPGRAAKEAIKGIINLPIPENIADQNSVKWDSDSLNPVAIAAIRTATQGIDNLRLDKLTDPNERAAELKKALNNLKGNALEAYSSLDKDTRDALQNYFVAGAANIFNANINADNFISRTTGQVLNPNLELVFQGVNLRNLDFAFTFTPRSQAEANTVKGIIKTFKRRMAAKTTATGGSTGNGIFIRTPDVFKMEFKRGSKKHPFLYSMKNAALKNITTSYSGAGPYISYEDGAPVKITMRLLFTELSPIYAEDYNNISPDQGVGF